MSRATRRPTSGSLARWLVVLLTAMALGAALAPADALATCTDTATTYCAQFDSGTGSASVSEFMSGFGMAEAVLASLLGLLFGLAVLRRLLSDGLGE